MSEKVLQIMCPNLTCRCILAVPESARGKVVRCARCGTDIRVAARKSPPVPAESAQTERHA